MKVRDLCQSLEQFLGAAIRQSASAPDFLKRRGMRPSVTIQSKNSGRKRRGDGPAAKLNAIENDIVISFVPDVPRGDGDDPSTPPVDDSDSSKSRGHEPEPIAAAVDPRLKDLIQALQETERQGRSFVSWVWFRDNVLVRFPWALEQLVRQKLIADAVRDGVLDSGKVQNPKNSQFPVTTILLNRRNETVRMVLGASGQRPMFEPAAIGGPPISRTILDSRR